MTRSRGDSVTRSYGAANRTAIRPRGPTRTHTDRCAGSETYSETYLNTDPDTDSDSDSVTDSDADSDADSGADAHADSYADSYADSDADSDTDSDTDSGSGHVQRRAGLDIIVQVGRFESQ